MKWLRMLFKNNIKVYVLVGDDLQPLEDSKGAKFVYQLKNNTAVYSAKRSNLAPIPGAQVEEADIELQQAADKDQKKSKSKSQSADIHRKEVLEPGEVPVFGESIPPGVIVIYTDGGCSPNPGPGGLGIIMMFGQHTLEKWEYFPHTTNNVCELLAILHSLQQVKNKSLPTFLYSDSAYAIGVSTGSMKAKANQEIIAQIHEEIAKFTNLNIQKVRAHIGVKYNEHVDSLCALARDTRESGERRS